jgi:very-short-patch-repair endonuclease
MEVSRALTLLGGIASSAQLRAAGCSQDRIDRAARSGAIQRIRRGWFAVESADPASVIAVACGGNLSCVSLLRTYRVWLPHDPFIHVRIDPDRHARSRPGVRSHWLRATDTPTAGCDSLTTSLEVAIQCLSDEFAVAAIDSLRERHLVSVSRLREQWDGWPRASRLLAKSVGDSGSGIETLVRLRLAARGLRIRRQVVIEGVGRVDFVVGDRLIVEVDGREFHGSDDAFDRDRRRDLAAVARGYLVVRLSYRQVMHEWPGVEQQVLGLIRRREHLWRSRHPAATGG